MSNETGRSSIPRRIAINVGSGFVPGINAVVIGAARAAAKMGWVLVGIRDGFEGLLHPEKYEDKGLVNLSQQLIENLDPTAGSILGQSIRVDPFHVSISNEPGTDEEADESNDVINRLKTENIDGLISIVGHRGLTFLYTLHRKGLSTACIPRSIDNDIASTGVSFGFNTSLSITIEMLYRARMAAKAARNIAVVEVHGGQSGWIALQSGIAACADVILIPEISVDLKVVAARLKDKISSKRPYGMVVVAKGAKFISHTRKLVDISSLKATLLPSPTGESNSEEVIMASGQTAQTVATELQLLLAEETYPLIIGPLVICGHPTSVDRQLGMAYGAGALLALNAGKRGVVVSFMPPEIRFVPLEEAINKVRLVPAESEFLKIADSLGIYYGQ